MAICSVLMLAWLPAPQSFAASISAAPTYFPLVAPILISSYKTSNGAKTLEYVEIYNAGSEPVDVAQWVLNDTVNAQRISFRARVNDGILEPGRHVIISRDGIIGNSSYVLNEYEAAKPMTALDLVRDGYRTVANVFNTKYVDRLMTRNMTTTGYSQAASPFDSSTRPLLTDGVTQQVFDDGLYVPPVVPLGLRIVEVYPYASDCTPFDDSVLCGDYVKLYNDSDADVSVDDMVLRTDSGSGTRTSSNTVTLMGIIAAHGYMTVAATDGGSMLSLTNSGGYVWLEDMWGLVSYKETATAYVAASTTEQGYAYAMGTDGVWAWTTTPQPNRANVMTAPVVVATECAEGKYRNPETGRCRNIEEAVNALAVCAEGEERNPATGRCRKLTVKLASTLVPCGDGQERNPATNRCRSIASAVAELLPCDEGYERNPATNRCRKIPVSDMPLAAFPVEPTKPTSQTLGMWLAVGGVVAAAAGYAAWEWRREIAGGYRRLIAWVTLGHK